MGDLISTFLGDISARASGIMKFRFYIQPAMAIIFAVLDGWKDARSGSPPYFWALLTRPEQRKDLLRSGWKSVGKICVAALVLDVIYQIRVFKGIHPGESMFVALLLAIVPYVLLRGPVARLLERRLSRPKAIGRGA